MPAPSACQELPSHEAMFDTVTPPALLNVPPATSWPL